MSPIDGRSILIVGGGIGGLSVALALARRGRRVTVLERAAQFGEIGAGLQIAPNASRVLDRLGVLEAIGRHAVFPSRLVFMDALSGERISAIDCGAAFTSRYVFPYLVMHRSDLLDVLLAACRAEARITLLTAQDVRRAENVGDGVEAVCADGSVHRGLALVAADGLHSTIRRMLSDDAPVAAPYVAYRGAIPMEEMSAHAGLDNVVMWVGPQMHFVQYPVRRGELYNQVAVFGSRRYREGSEDWGTVEELEAHYAQTCDHVRRALTKIRRDRRWPMVDRQPIATWTQGRVTLLGDAAHPMLQYLAQGACQAIEDAGCLADQVAAQGEDLAAAFQAYQEARYLRTARVQLTAHFFGEICHAEGVGRTLRNAWAAQRAEADFTYLDWLWGWQG
jgi:2-polyprenyl-6-methoxyphenol hydroxylase-like FAD-dependent oxidoreductase